MAKKPLRGIELQDKETQKKLKYTGILFRKSLLLKDAC